MFWRTVIGLGILLTALRVWTGPVPLIEPVNAQIPDSGLQQQQQLDETRRTNQLLQEIKKILETGTLNVRFPGADNPSDAPVKTRKRG
jgi:hypothetical protein